MDPERERLGRERMMGFLEAQGRLHAEAMSLTMTLSFAANLGYSDDALDAIRRDARDLITAAHALAGQARTMADEWAKQRRTVERCEHVYVTTASGVQCAKCGDEYLNG